MIREPVDAVITWVDGNDQTHVYKLANYLAMQGIERPEDAAPTRFHHCGELDYCVKSILRFAPWIRTIYIVTSAQTPNILQQLQGTPYEEKVKLVDERVIFSGFESCLPTFNSISIETLLWRIPGLADRFVYFNDDWAIIRPVAYDDFFRDDNIVLRGYWKVQSDRKPGRSFKKWLDYLLRKPQDKHDIYRVVQENSAKLAGFRRRFFHLPHAPLPVKKSLFADYFSTHPDAMLQNAQYTFRAPQQFLPFSLAQHLAIKQNQVVFDNSLLAAYVNGAFHSPKKIKQRLAKADKNNKAAFVCTQSLDALSQAAQRKMLAWLEQRIG